MNEFESKILSGPDSIIMNLTGTQERVNQAIFSLNHNSYHLKISIVYQVLHRHYFWWQPGKVDIHTPTSQMMKVEHRSISPGKYFNTKLLTDGVATLPLAGSWRPAPFHPVNCLSTTVASSHST